MSTISTANKSFKAIIAVALAVLLALTMAAWPASAFAAESSSASSGKASNASESSSSPEAEQKAKDIKQGARGGLPLMGNDYVWFGRELVLSATTIENDVIAAGEVINLTDVSAMGDFRVAARTIDLVDCSVGQNISAAAETVDIANTDANAIMATGRAVTFDGNCNSLTVYAEKVFINGTVNGDVVVGANSVEVGTNARIAGTLHVDAASEPVMQRGAEVGDVAFTKSDNASKPSTGDADAALAGLLSAFSVFIAIMTVLGTLVVAVLAEWLFRRQTAGAAEMIRNRTGAMIGTGVIAALVAPLAVIMLLFLGVTLPVAGGIAFALFAMTAVAGGFAGASLFKLAFPKMGRYKCALAGGAIVGVASVIPFLGSLVSAAAFMYLLGYVLQSIFLGMRDPAPGTPGAPMVGTPYAPAPSTPYAPAAAPAAPYAPATTAPQPAAGTPDAPVVSNPVPAPDTSEPAPQAPSKTEPPTSS